MTLVFLLLKMPSVKCAFWIKTESKIILFLAT